MSRFFVLLVGLLAFALTGCNFTEEITFQPDGSGEFIMNYDLSEVMKTLEKMGGDKEGNENDKKEKIDSIVYFKDILAEKSDSISKLSQIEQDKLQSLETIVMRIKMDEATGSFDFGFGSTFKNLDELPDVLEKIEQAKEFNSKDDAQFSKMEQSAVAKSAKNLLEYVDFSYDGKTFSRALSENYKPSSEDIEALNTEISQMGESKDTFEGMTYTLIYHFPKTIKSVSNTKAEISNDKKTVTLKMNFLEMIKSPENATLNVILND
ncbi:hypothetical protein [Xanthomarina sp. GH4-25]|uniref:hypothetical protein n=1 Tax=Xanthomarina sp. GH4-25 TaxID=3349335 RepID=UPI000D674661|nr:hypothetical protein DI383_06265 [Flavobacteriaceae bacterium LYZ1037]